MIDFKYNTKGFVDEEEFQKQIDIVRSTVPRVQENSFGGWADLPINYDKEEFARIKKAAERINLNSDYLVCIGAQPMCANTDISSVKVLGLGI